MADPAHDSKMDPRQVSSWMPSLRDRWAGEALATLQVGTLGSTPLARAKMAKLIAEQAFAIADAMIEARK